MEKAKRNLKGKDDFWNLWLSNYDVFIIMKSRCLLFLSLACVDQPQITVQPSPLPFPFVNQLQNNFFYPSLRNSLIQLWKGRQFHTSQRTPRVLFYSPFHTGHLQILPYLSYNHTVPHMAAHHNGWSALEGYSLVVEPGNYFCTYCRSQ